MRAPLFLISLVLSSAACSGTADDSGQGAASQDESGAAAEGAGGAAVPATAREEEAAAVMARLLAEMAESPLEVVAHGIQQLIDADMLALRQSTPQTEHGFRHVTIRDVLYGSLLREARVDWHARATRALEANYADRLQEHMDALADHSYAGELWAETSRYQLVASVRAVAGSARARAIPWLPASAASGGDAEAMPLI